MEAARAWATCRGSAAWKPPRFAACVLWTGGHCGLCITEVARAAPGAAEKHANGAQEVQGSKVLQVPGAPPVKLLCSQALHSGPVMEGAGLMISELPSGSFFHCLGE